MSATDPRTEAGIDAVSRAVYDLAQLHVSPLDVNVGVVANGVMRLSLTEAIEIAFRAADAVDTRVQQLTEAALNMRGALLAQFAHHTLAGDTLEALEAFDDVASGFAEVDASQEPAAVSGERAGDAT